MIEYKDYLAALEYDDVEDLIYRRAINSGTSIATFAAGDVEGLQREFQNFRRRPLGFLPREGH